MRRLFVILACFALSSHAAATEPSAAQPGAPSTSPSTPLPPGAPPGLPPAPGGPAPAPAPGDLPVAPAPASPAAQTTAAPPEAARPDKKLSVIRVNITNQPWDFIRPWGKRSPYTRRAIGAVLPGKRVLVTGELVANANYLEFEMPEGGQRVPASIEAVDYEANLAVLKADDPKFLDSFEPLELTTVRVGDTVTVWQLESTGTLLQTKGSMTTAEVSRYPIDESPLLVYRAAVSLQFRDSSFTLPVVKDDKLIGIVMRYDNSTKSVEVVPTPVIEHFLKDVEKAPYEGFPRAGLAYSNTRDPQLRRFAGLNGNGPGGVYVTDVQRGGPAEKAGLREGDVVLKIAGYAIDQDGNYADPVYGKLALTHLVGTRHFHGDKLAFSVFRKGETKDIEVQIAHRPVDDYVVEPYVIDRGPRFYVLGGLVLQELSRQYLKEWGPDWMKKAPEELVYLDRQQAELFKDGPKKLVMLSVVLPSPSTIGYEDLHQLIVKRINGLTLQKLADVPIALNQSANGLHKIEFDGDPSCVYLDAAAIAAGDEALMSNYRIPTLKRLE